jgi:hypothetical protein
MPDGDFDYYDPGILRVAGDAIRAEGAKWDGMARDMGTVASTMKELWLSPTAFMVADPWAGPAVSVDQFRIYDDVHTLLCDQVDGATTEFAELAEVMPKLAAEYEKSDERSYISLNKIYTKS